MKEKIQIKIHFKDTWTEVSTGDVLNVEYSTETIHVNNVSDGHDKAVQVQETAGVSVYEGVEHKREVVGRDVVDNKERVLNKEQMFDFILNNNVTLTPDGSLWTSTGGKKVRKNYTVSINGCGMSGMDLEEAIHHYINKVRGKK